MASALPAPPPGSVLEAFGLRGQPERLAGGQQEAFVADAAVLKPAHDRAEAAWVQDLADRVGSSSVRLARPLPAADGGWVHQGWTACELIPGLRPAAPDWEAVIEAGRQVSAAVAAIDGLDTSVLAGRSHRWARADRCAWDEEAVDLPGRAADLLEAVRELTVPAEHGGQVIHGDLAGNVHVDPAGKPVVLDLSPYLRPVRWAEAIVIVDAMAWWAAPVRLAASFAADPVGLDLLARAAIFRLTAESSDTLATASNALEPYDRLVVELGRLR